MNLRNFLKILILAPVAAPAVIKIVESLATPKTIGFKGSQLLEAGFVYAPYIPLYQTCYLIADELIEIQPMNQPTGKVFYKDFWKKEIVSA